MLIKTTIYKIKIKVGWFICLNYIIYEHKMKFFYIIIELLKNYDKSFHLCILDTINKIYRITSKIAPPKTLIFKKKHRLEKKEKNRIFSLKKKF